MTNLVYRIQRRAGDVVPSAALRSAIALAIVAAGPVLTLGGTIRDDVPDSDYLTLANDPKYASVGAVIFPDLFATGTLISPYWVLTAAHVAQDGNTPSFNIGGSTASNGTIYGTVQHFTNPGWAGALSPGGNDVGLIRLSTPVTNIIPASRLFAGNELGQIGTSVGFGQTGTGLTGAIGGTQGTKRTFQNVVDQYTNGDATTNGTTPDVVIASDFDDPNGLHSLFGSSIAQQLEGGVAPGDSGGGNFFDINGKAYLAGVHSFAAPNYGYGSYYGSTRVLIYNTWIDDNTTNGWKTASSGSFTTNSNWSLGPTATGASPIANDIAGFNVIGSYTVTFDGTALQNYQLLARSGDVTLNLNGSTYSLLSQAYDGALVVGRYSGNSASITLTAGTLNTRDAIIGQLLGSNGRITMGPNSTWNATGDVYVGGASHGSGGNATLTIANSTAAVNVSGTMHVFGGGKVIYSSGTVSLGTLDMSGGSFTMPTGAGRVLQTRKLMMSGPAKLDLNDNDMIIDYTGDSPVSDVQYWVKEGFNNGLQNEFGVISTRAKTSPNAGESGKTRIGFGDASAAGITNFDGIAVDSTTVLLKYTYAGDANLDGKVDVKDLLKLASSWLTGSVWTSGDFNYDGAVNAADLGLLSANWQAGISAPLGPDLSFAATLSALGLPAVSQVPEPASLLSIGLGAASLLRRRRRPTRAI